MTKNRLMFTVASVLAALALAVPGGAAAQSMPEKCTLDFARTTLADGGASDLCGCTTLTRGFVEYLQQRPDFLDVLTELEGSCVGLANVLGDLPTATLPGGSGGPERGGDDGVAADQSYGPVSFNFTPTQDSTTDPGDDDPPDGDDPDGDDPGHGHGHKKGKKGHDHDHDKWGDRPGGRDRDKPGDRDHDKPGGKDHDKWGDKPGGGDRDKPDGLDNDKPGGSGKDKGDNGHGNNDGKNDPSNPGKKPGSDKDGYDSDGMPPGFVKDRR